MLAGDHIDMVWAGFIVGCISLVFVYIAIRVLSLRLPLKPLFLGTSILMFIMSISFLGAGIKELIEGDVITMTASPLVSWIPSNPVLEVLGIFPCDQTIFAQLIMLAIVIIVWIWHMRKNKKLREEVAAAKAAEEQAAAQQ
jgi:high-affinity iron transporter